MPVLTLNSDSDLDSSTDTHSSDLALKSDLSDNDDDNEGEMVVSVGSIYTTINFKLKVGLRAMSKGENNTIVDGRGLYTGFEWLFGFQHHAQYNTALIYAVRVTELCEFTIAY